jgi:hypothetical protein
MFLLIERRKYKRPRNERRINVRYGDGKVEMA